MTTPEAPLTPCTCTIVVHRTHNLTSITKRTPSPSCPIHMKKAAR